LELQIAQIWEDLLNIHPIGIKDKFFSLGGHSLVAVRLMARIKEKFRQELPLSTLFQGATVENLANTLREQSDVLIPSPLVGIQPHGSKPPFFCVHPIGGNVLCYLDLVRCLDNPDQPFYGLQAPGLNGEQEPFTRIEDIAAYYVDSLRDLQPSGPYFVGGWSFGGVVAFEMAQQLLQQGQQVSLLALLDSRVPSLSHAPMDNDDALVSYFALDLGGLLGLDLPALRDHLHHLEPKQQLYYVLQQARSAGTLPPDAELGQIQYFLRVYQANIHALHNYVPQVYSGQITLFQASDQLNASLDPSMGWSRLAFL
jgi:thioesterase domain-containing protein/acyl carrier protein